MAQDVALGVALLPAFVELPELHAIHPSKGLGLVVQDDWHGEQMVQNGSASDLGVVPEGFLGMGMGIAPVELVCEGSTMLVREPHQLDMELLTALDMSVQLGGRRSLHQRHGVTVRRQVDVQKVGVVAAKHVADWMPSFLQAIYRVIQ